jgi:hypothetical protein
VIVEGIRRARARSRRAAVVEAVVEERAPDRREAA